MYSSSKPKFTKQPTVGEQGGQICRSQSQSDSVSSPGANIYEQHGRRIPPPGIPEPNIQPMVTVATQCCFDFWGRLQSRVVRDRLKSDVVELHPSSAVYNPVPLVKGWNHLSASFLYKTGIQTLIQQNAHSIWHMIMERSLRERQQLLVIVCRQSLKKELCKSDFLHNFNLKTALSK